MEPRRPRSRFLPPVFPLALAFLTAVSGPMAASSGKPSGPGAVAAALQAMFMESDVTNLKPYLSLRVKTYLALSDVGPSNGYYGADQALLLLRRMFSDRTTLRFTLTPPPERPGTIVLQGNWTFRDDTTPRSELHFAFTVVPDGSAWRIREIRAHK